MQPELNALSRAIALKNRVYLQIKFILGVSQHNKCGG